MFSFARQIISKSKCWSIDCRNSSYQLGGYAFSCCWDLYHLSTYSSSLPFSSTLSRGWGQNMMGSTKGFYI